MHCRGIIKWSLVASFCISWENILNSKIRPQCCINVIWMETWRKGWKCERVFVFSEEKNLRSLPKASKMSLQLNLSLWTCPRHISIIYFVSNKHLKLCTTLSFAHTPQKWRRSVFTISIFCHTQSSTFQLRDVSMSSILFICPSWHMTSGIRLLKKKYFHWLIHFTESQWKCVLYIRFPENRIEVIQYGDENFVRFRLTIQKDATFRHVICEIHFQEWCLHPTQRNRRICTSPLASQSWINSLKSNSFRLPIEMQTPSCKSVQFFLWTEVC